MTCTMKCFKRAKEEINCQVCLLDGKVLDVNVQGHARGSDLQERVFEHLQLAETDCFSLRYKDKENATQWLHPLKSLNKQIQSMMFLTLYFGVKFYLEDPCQLREEVTRYQFFLQLKQDILNGKLPCGTKTAAVLASLCVQSELGDYDSSQHTEGYISEFRFIPNQTEEFENHVQELHKSLRGMSPPKAEIKFLEKVQRLEMYGVDLHKVIGQDGQEYYIGLTPAGISIYQNKNKIAHYYWPKISTVHHEGTKFMLAVQRKSDGANNEYSFQLGTKEACRHLWNSCVEQHAFFRLPSFNSTTFRHSGRTKKEALELSSSLRRQQPQVERTPSRRFSRRLSLLNSDAEDGDDIILRSGQFDSHTSAHSTTSLPWENSNHNRGGLYSSSIDIYESGRSRKRKPSSHSSRMYHSERSGDESESGFAQRYRRNASMTELSELDVKENRNRRRQRRRRKVSRGTRGGETSGSDTESDYFHSKPQYRNDNSFVMAPANGDTSGVLSPSVKQRNDNSFVMTPANGNTSGVLSRSVNQSQSSSRREPAPQNHSLMKRSPASHVSSYQIDGKKSPHENGHVAEPSCYGDDTRHSPREKSQLTESGLLAMQVLQEELVRISKPKDKGGRLSLTSQEILRVSKSSGENHNLMTEL